MDYKEKVITLLKSQELSKEQKEKLEEIFPELTESEDEKIRKWLIGYFNQYIIDGMPQVFGNGLNVKDVIAWLEKQGEIIKEWSEMKMNNIQTELQYRVDLKQKTEQGEQKPADEIGNYDHGKVLDSLMSAVIKTPEESLGIDSDTYNKIVDECIYGEQKPNKCMYSNDNYTDEERKVLCDGCDEDCKLKQKPADKSKIKPKFKTGDRVVGVVSGMPYFITEVCDDHYNTESGCIIMFCSQDNFDLYELKPAWSEEDEENIKVCIDSIKHSCYSYSTKQRAENFLKSLRPQKQQEWNKQDIEMIDWLIRCCEKEHEELCNDRYGHQDIVSDLKRDCRKKWDWLESLKNKVVPQNKWKPSDEQMEVLLSEVNAWTKGCPKQKILKSLYDDLKKLKS